MMLLAGFGSMMVMGNKKIMEEDDIFISQKQKEAYFSGYGYSMDNPNVIVNPYGNSPLTALVLFEMDDYSDVFVTIKGKDNDDINYRVHGERHHVIPIYALYADYDNTVIIKIGDKEKTLNIKTDKLPDDFNYEMDTYDYFSYGNNGYPYIADNNGEVRWYLNKHYFGNISFIDNFHLVIGSDKYDEEGKSISLYQMDLLGKIDSEYLIENGYYGYNAIYGNDILAISDNVVLVDRENGEMTKKIKNDNFNYVGVSGNDIIVSKDSKYYKVINEELSEVDNIVVNFKYTFDDNIPNYKVVISKRFGTLKKTENSNTKISLLSYKKGNLDKIKIIKSNDRIVIQNMTGEKVYIILEKFFDKRIYEVDDIKYINILDLHGKYTIYYKMGKQIYKTDYYFEV